VWTKIKKDRSDQHSPRCPDHFGPSVSKLDSRVGKPSAKANIRSHPTLTVDTWLKRVVEALSSAKQLTDFVIDHYSFCYSLAVTISPTVHETPAPEVDSTIALDPATIDGVMAPMFATLPS
jgi:hypothetical protein